MNGPMHLSRNAGLPTMGVSPSGPRQVSRADVDAICACHDVEALAELKAYARSYFAASGMIVISAGGAAVAALSGHRRVAIGAVVSAVFAGLGVIEARRRAREWEAIVDARLLALTGARESAPDPTTQDS